MKPIFVSPIRIIQLDPPASSSLVSLILTLVIRIGITVFFQQPVPIFRLLPVVFFVRRGRFAVNRSVLLLDVSRIVVGLVHIQQDLNVSVQVPDIVQDVTDHNSLLRAEPFWTWGLSFFPVSFALVLTPDGGSVAVQQLDISS